MECQRFTFQYGWRPGQKSLFTKSILSDSRSEVKEVCQMGNQEILVRKLCDHLRSCGEGLETGDEGEGQGDEGESDGNGTIMLTPGTSSNSSTSTSVQPSLELEASTITNLDPHSLPAASLSNIATTTPTANVQVIINQLQQHHLHHLKVLKQTRQQLHFLHKKHILISQSQQK